MIDDEDNGLKRVARVWLAFILFGGLIGLSVFLGLVVGLKQNENISAIIALALGLSIGFGLANVLAARRMAAKIFRLLGFIEWHAK